MHEDGFDRSIVPAFHMGMILITKTVVKRDLYSFIFPHYMCKFIKNNACMHQTDFTTTKKIKIRIGMYKMREIYRERTLIFHKNVGNI